MSIFILFNLNILNLNSFKSPFSGSKRCFRCSLSMTVCDLPSLQQCDAICGANDLISQISRLHVLLLMVEACQLESCLRRLIVNAWMVLVLSGNSEADRRRLGNKPPSFGRKNKSPPGLEVRSTSFSPLFLLQTLFYLFIATGRRWITVSEDFSTGVKEEWWLGITTCQ